MTSKIITYSFLVEEYKAKANANIKTTGKIKLTLSSLAYNNFKYLKILALTIFT